MENQFSWNKVLGVNGEESNASPVPKPLTETLNQTPPDPIPITPSVQAQDVFVEEEPKPETSPVFKENDGATQTIGSTQTTSTDLTGNSYSSAPNSLNEELSAIAQSNSNNISIEWVSPSSQPEEPRISIQSKDEIAVDPRTGLALSDEELNNIPNVAKKSHYAPAAVDPKIHSMDVSEHKFDSPTEHSGHSSFTPIDMKALDNVHIDDILREAIERKASDIHLTSNLPPMVRIDGELMPLSYRNLNPEDTKRIIYDTLTDDKIEKFENTHELDFAYTVKGLSRFRFNAYVQRGSVAASLRAIPAKIPAFEVLGLPPIIREMSKRNSGLILVTGPTGSGKSTTIASMLDEINETRNSHIITLEDPIEYLHNHKKCMVNQREIHSDTYSFSNALRAVLREDPDIILVGELRDLETIEAALTLAETGHLVFGTLHTRNAPSTIDRVVDVFPSEQQAQIRVLLGNTLEGVVSQQLIPKLGGGRCAGIEIMLGSAAIKNLIREGKTHQMYSMIETGAQFGMQTMDSSLAAHFRNGFCSYDDLLMAAVDKDSFARLAKQAA